MSILNTSLHATLPAICGASVVDMSSLRTDLDLWYNLNETSGIRYDSVGTHPLTDLNTVGYSTGKKGNAASYVATSSERLYHAAYYSELDPQHTSNSGDFTTAFWVKSTNGATEYVYNAIASGYHQHLANWNVAGRMSFSCRDTANTGFYLSNASSSMAAGTWYLVIFDFIAATAQMRMQVDDGTPVTGTLGGTGILQGGSGSKFYLGGNSSGSLTFTGLQDEFAFWTRQLTTEEKEWLWNGGAGITYEDTAAP